MSKHRDISKGARKEKQERNSQSSRSAKQQKQIRVAGTWERQTKRFVEVVRSHMFHRK